MSRCLTCNHVISETSDSHSKCRSHADCVVDFQYSPQDCEICEGLWGDAISLDDPTTALQAYEFLITWVRGFAKNSQRKNKKGDIFRLESDREDFEVLRASLMELPELKGIKISKVPPIPARAKEIPGNSGSLEDVGQIADPPSHQEVAHSSRTVPLIQLANLYEEEENLEEEEEVVHFVEDFPRVTPEDEETPHQVRSQVSGFLSTEVSGQASTVFHAESHEGEEVTVNEEDNSSLIKQLESLFNSRFSKMESNLESKLESKLESFERRMVALEAPFEGFPDPPREDTYSNKRKNSPNSDHESDPKRGKRENIPSPPPEKSQTDDKDSSDEEPEYESESESPSLEGGDSPPHERDQDQIPEGWFILEPGMALGETPGSLVMKDGTCYGPETVEFDMTNPIRPLWRYIRLKGAAPKEDSALIPVRKAFESLISSLRANPLSAKEWSSYPFSPPGARGNRAFSVEIKDNSIVGRFLENFNRWFSKMAEKGKPSWDETTGPANIIPASLSFISAQEYVEFFARKPFSADEARSALEAHRLPDIPKNFLTAEHQARSELLDALNLTLALESGLIQGEESPAQGILLASLKLSLRPLWTSFLNFGEKKLQLRIKALAGCKVESPHYNLLIKSDPLSPDLFAKEIIDKIKDQALHQAKPISFLIGLPEELQYARPPRGRSHRRPRYQNRNFLGRDFHRLGRNNDQIPMGQTSRGQSQPGPSSLPNFRGRGRGVLNRRQRRPLRPRGGFRGRGNPNF